MLTIPEIGGDLPEVFQKFKESIFAELHVATIGTVLNVDTASGLLTVQPVISERRVQSDGTIVWQAYAPIADTPYISPLGIAPKVGQPVLLIFCDHDISAWLSTTGEGFAGVPAPQLQQVVQSHNVNSAIAVLGMINGVVPTGFAGFGNSITGSTTDMGTGLSKAGVQFIEQWEGLSTDWTQDVAGNWLIGYGHRDNSKTLPGGFTAPLTAATAEALLLQDLPGYTSTVIAALPGVTLSTTQLDALTSFLYSCGHLGVTPGLIIAKARSFLGLTESPRNSNNVIFNTDYYGHPVSGADAYPWCVTFVWDIFRMVGASALLFGGAKIASSTTLMNWGKDRGLFVDKNSLQAGDVVFYSWSGSTTVATHTEIVESVNGDGTITAIGGNTSSAAKDANGGQVVEHTDRSLSEVLGGYRPKYDPAGGLEWTALKNAIASGTTGEALKTKFDAYSQVGGQVVQKLLYRRDAEWAMFENGSYLSP